MNERQMRILQQGVLVTFAVGIQLALYFAPPYLPYPVYVKHPEFSRLFFLVYTLIFLESIISGIALGWRYLPLIVFCLAGTTLALWILIAMMMTISTLFSRLPTNVLIKDIENILRILTEEEAMPSVIWGLAGGLCGSFPHPLLKQKMGKVRWRLKFLFHISVAVFITIVIFGVASFLSTEFLVFGAPIIFVGVTVGMIIPTRAISLACMSQVLLSLVILGWMFSTAHGEGTMIILPTFFIGLPCAIGFGVMGALYGKYLRNHFFGKANKIDMRSVVHLSGGKK